MHITANNMDKTAIVRWIVDVDPVHELTRIDRMDQDQDQDQDQGN